MVSTGTHRKLTSELTAHDFECHTVWLVDMPLLDYTTSVAPFESLETDEPYIALTNYLLHDGTVARGYCYIYDHTGFTLFSNDGTPISISDYPECSATEALNISKALRRTVEEIFPIHYQATVKVFGSLVEGDITMQPNLSLNPDAPTSGTPVG